MKLIGNAPIILILLLVTSVSFAQTSTRLATYTGSAKHSSHRPTTSQKEGFSSHYFKFVEVHESRDNFQFSTIDSKFLNLNILGRLNGNFTIFKDVDCSTPQNVFDCSAELRTDLRTFSRDQLDKTIAMLKHDDKLSMEDIRLFNDWLKTHIQLDPMGYSLSKTLICLERYPVSRHRPTSTFGVGSITSAHERVCSWATVEEQAIVKKAFGKGEKPTDFKIDGVPYSNLPQNHPLYKFLKPHHMNGWNDPEEATRVHHSTVETDIGKHMGYLTIRVSRQMEILEPHFELTLKYENRFPFIPYDGVGLIDSIRALNKIPYQNQVTNKKARSLLKFTGWETYVTSITQAFDDFEFAISSGVGMFVHMGSTGEPPLFDELSMPSNSLPSLYKKVVIVCDSPNTKFKYGKRYCPIEFYK